MHYELELEAMRQAMLIRSYATKTVNTYVPDTQVLH